MNVRSVTVFKKRMKQREVGVYRLGAISKFIRAQGNGISFACVLASRLRFTMLSVSPPPPMYAQYAMQSGRWPAGRTIYK